jgi:hypothetical protein
VLLIEENGMDRSIRKLEWHISKFSFCNGISLTHESYSGIDPINPITNYDVSNPSRSITPKVGMVKSRYRSKVPVKRILLS